ncbi:MAG: hypothetical protein HDQ88_02240 [Clostridia bacterium]|nr:hypothetical protein [Clostridia bacterium]
MKTLKELFSGFNKSKPVVVKPVVEKQAPPPCFSPKMPDEQLPPVIVSVKELSEAIAPIDKNGVMDVLSDDLESEVKRYSLFTTLAWKKACDESLSSGEKDVDFRELHERAKTIFSQLVMEYVDVDLLNATQIFNGLSHEYVLDMITNKILSGDKKQVKEPTQKKITAPNASPKKGDKNAPEPR